MGDGLHRTLHNYYISQPAPGVRPFRSLRSSTMYWPAFAWMGANPVVPAPEEQAPLDDDHDSLFDFGEEDESDLLYDNILGIYDELGGDEFDGFNAYEFFNTMEEDDLADIAFLLQALGPKTRQRGIKFKHTRKSWGGTSNIEEGY